MLNKARDYIKQWFQVRQYNSELSELIGRLSNEIQSLKLAMTVPENYFRTILNRDLDWYDFDKLDQGSKVMYYADCQNILSKDAFQNELNHQIADLIKFCATMEGIKAEDKLMVLTNVQTAIVALETFRNRLKQIENPAKHKEVVDPFEAL